MSIHSYLCQTDSLFSECVFLSERPFVHLSISRRSAVRLAVHLSASLISSYPNIVTRSFFLLYFLYLVHLCQSMYLFNSDMCVFFFIFTFATLSITPALSIFASFSLIFRLFYCFLPSSSLLALQRSPSPTV